jgi:hypothetical protein
MKKSLKILVIASLVALTPSAASAGQWQIAANSVGLIWCTVPMWKVTVRLPCFAG